MTPNKLLQALFIAACSLAFVLTAVFLLRRPQMPGAPFARHVDDAQKITLESGVDRVELQKSSPTWTVAVATGAPNAADDAKIKTLLEKLRNLQVEDVISERPDRAADFEIDPAKGLTVTLMDTKGGRLAAGVIGKQAPDFSHLYFKYTDKPDVYLARNANRAQFGAPQAIWWRDRVLLNITEDQVITIVIDRAGSKAALARAGDTWTLNGKTLDPTPVWGMLGVLAHLRASEFVDLKTRPDLSPEKLRLATVILQLRDGSTHTLRIGSQDAATKRYPIAVNGDAGTAWVEEAAMHSVLQRPSDFPKKK